MSAEITQQLQKDFEDVFNGTGCFDGTFSFQLKMDSKLYQVSLRSMAYTLQKPFDEEFKQLLEQNTIIPLGVHETAKWYNSFVLISKAMVE